MAVTLRIFHRTVYRYDRPVTFGPHRMMVRPRDGHDLWVLDASLLIVPTADLHWRFDTFGNSIALATFSDPSEILVIENNLLIERYPREAAAFPPDHRPTPFPFTYDSDDQIDLSPLMALQNPQDLPVLQQWLDSVFGYRPSEALAFLRTLSDAINRSFAYSWRDQLGTQSAAATIESGQGTCRDLAFLFMEAARSFGFAARFVTGYLHDPAGGEGLTGGGATHAWAEIFIPSEGWVEFDPTNCIVGGGALIKVAATRTPSQASPITGSFKGGGAKFLDMDVSVTVAEEPPQTDSDR